MSRLLEEVLPADLVAEIAAHSEDERVSSLYKFHLRTGTGRTGKPAFASLRSPVTFQPEHAKGLIAPLDIRPRLRLQPVLER